MTAVAEAPALVVEHPPIYWETILSGWTRREGREYGDIEARKWTKPLRPLTPETSAGFDVIEFGEDVCGIVLYPWQRWLLIHALELNEDGTYRFKRVHLLVGRQNGKTTVAKLLVIYWLYIDATANPGKLHPRDFEILATAQNLEKAAETWEQVLDYCDPAPPKDKDAASMPLVPALQALSRKPSRRTGFQRVRTKVGASYSIASITGTRAGRGGSKARIFLDELREHRTWDAWNAIKNTKNARWNAQLWTASNAGDRRAIVLKELRQQMLDAVDEWEKYVEQGLWDIERWANKHDATSAIFEWSAEPGRPKSDVEGILQSNPSVGWGNVELSTLLADSKSDPEAEFRTEVLCQWVETLVTPHVDPTWWDACHDGSASPDGRLVASFDVSFDRKRAYVGVAGIGEDGVPVIELITRRTGSAWILDYAVKLRDNWGIREIAIQSRGCGASEWVEPLRKLGFTVHEIQGFHVGAACGLFKELVESAGVRHRDQNALNLSVTGTQAKKNGEQMFWDRAGSIVDAAATVAVSQALYSLLRLDPPEEEAPSAYEERGLRTVG